jgi:peptidoglycan/LPS O-acetylase OafA/YrhL
MSRLNVSEMTTARRIDALTGLRFVAALAVFLSHLQPAPGVPAPVQTFMRAGYDGVTLFFILSGFVLAWNYDRRLGDRLTGRGLWSFAVARAAHQLIEKPAQRLLRRLLDPRPGSGRVVDHDLAEHVAGVQPLERGADVAERVHRVDHRPGPGLRHEREQATQLLRRAHARTEDLQL